MKVRDLMTTSVATLSVHDDLGLADDIMKQGRIRHLPVVDGARIVGIVSQRDLYRAGLSCLLEIDPANMRGWLQTLAVRDLMTDQVECIGPDESVRSAAEQMLASKVGCLPVVEDGRLVGILSETDCVAYLVRVLNVDEVRRALPELTSGN
ncbi:MAG: CBS domain-containing protein [Deltaproteobacteria bacterium]|nr:CBS domain-containing protein [Deltaproteobacteria bacterium]